MRNICLNKTKTILVAAFLIVTFTNAYTQTNPQRTKFNRWGLGLRLNHLYDVKFTAYDKLANGFSGEDVSGLNGSKTKIDLAFGLDLIYFVSPLVSIDASYDMGKMTGANAIDYYESDVSFLTLGLNYDLKGRNQRTPNTWVPFLRASIGEGSYDTKRKFIEDEVTFHTESGTALQVGLGAGIRYHINDNWHLNLQSEFITTYTDAWDGYNYGSGKEHMAKTCLGLRYTFGKNKHQDRAVAWQFSNQNPADNSELMNKLLLSIGDSLKNINNKVEQLQANNNNLQAQLNKDTDEDGVPDIKDLCPGEKGALANGCNEAVIKKDSNNNNSKPSTPNGNTAPAATSSIANSGDAQLIKNMILIEMNNIRFGKGKSDLNSDAVDILNRTSVMLKRNANFKLVIFGHADQDGSEKANYRISQKRAQTVANYLTKKGIAIDRIEQKPMGKKELIDTATTAKAKANNRRVEFAIELMK
ncbi:MAG: OmpA family protein [Bacteroidota bacterium]